MHGIGLHDGTLHRAPSTAVGRLGGAQARSAEPGQLNCVPHRDRLWLRRPACAAPGRLTGSAGWSGYLPWTYT